jgi:ketol-acid reductoisomerase
MTRGNHIITQETKTAMKKILAEVKDGSFAREWIQENKAGRPVLAAKRQQLAQHPIESVGKQLRNMMSWIKKLRK